MESESGENQTVLKVEEKFFSGADDLSEYSFYFPLNHYRILSKETKQFMVEEVERTNLSYVSRKYGISPNNLYRWKKHCERKAGAGRKVSDRGMEERLIEWIRGELGKKRGNLTRKEIQNQAITFSSDPNFKASKGWFERFVKRNKTLDLAHYFGMRGMRSNRQGN
jgi:transposase-like protein